MAASDMLDLCLISCDNSMFTNPHEMLYHSPPVDRRSSFTHLGVKFEGVESSRHLNWIEKEESNLPSEKTKKNPTEEDNDFVFRRDLNVVNEVVIRIGNSKIRNRAIIKRLFFDTSFFTRNQVQEVKEIIFLDESTDPPEKTVLSGPIPLDGNSTKGLDITPVTASKMILKLAEGGLSRFRAFGTVIGPLFQFENLVTGGLIFMSTDNSFGDAALVLRPEREGNTMAGWETCRHSSIQLLGIVLPSPGRVQNIEIDTYLHRLNSFKLMAVFGAYYTNTDISDLVADLPLWNVENETNPIPSRELNQYIQERRIKEGKSLSYRINWGPFKYWKTVMKFKRLKPDGIHEFSPKEILSKDPVTHLLLIGVPDGGIHRIAVFGTKINRL